MLVYKELESSRLRLRALRKSDYQYEFDYQKNPENYPNADLIEAKSMEQVEKFFKRKIDDMEKKNSMFWVMTDKETGEPLGGLSFWNINKNHMSGEFGYNLYPNARGKGYMKEALETVMEYCKDVMGFKIFYIWTDENNIPSIKVAENLGFFYVRTVTEESVYSRKKIRYAVYKFTYENLFS